MLFFKYFLLQTKNPLSISFIDSRSSRMKNEENFVILFFIQTFSKADKNQINPK